MFTITTYGTWLRGDRRGWVEDGATFPPDPPLEARDRSRLNYPPFYFARETRLAVAREMVVQLERRLDLEIYAIFVQSWHAHFVTGAAPVASSEIVKCAKDAARYLLAPGRPIWGRGYDKRFCFDERSLRNRIRYVERHNEEDGLPGRLFEFLRGVPEG